MDTRARLEDYRSRLFGYAVSLTQDRDLSRDLVQDCALKALRANNVPSEEPAFRAWLFRILRNAYLDHLRALRQNADLSDDGAGAPSHQVWDTEDRMVDALTVRIAMAAMPAGQRDIIALIDVAGLRYAEVAELLEIPIGTVMSRISRARRALLLRIAGSNVMSLKSTRGGRRS